MTSEVAGGEGSDTSTGDSEASACTVALDAFSGPLDLLLYLVRRAEVDIIDIPISTIADQFVAAVDAWAQIDLDSAGDFILMAASLLELKARLVAPPLEDPASDEAEEEVIDLRAGLVGKLLAYRRCKEASLALERMEEQHRPRLARQLHEAIPEDPDELGIDLENADPYALAASFEAVMARIHGLGPRTVVADPLPLEAAITLLIETLQAQGAEQLSRLLATQPTRLGRVTVLMALLECARQRLIEVVQPEQYGDVRLRFRHAPERDAAPVLPPPEPDAPKRRKRPPLATWAGAAGDAEHDAPAPEEPIETDEQRFLRELEETCALEAALARAADIDGAFARFWAERRGLPWPPPPPEPASAPVATPAPAAAPSAPPPVARRSRPRPSPGDASPAPSAGGAGSALPASAEPGQPERSEGAAALATCPPDATALASAPSAAPTEHGQATVAAASALPAAATAPEAIPGPPPGPGASQDLAGTQVKAEEAPSSAAVAAPAIDALAGPQRDPEAIDPVPSCSAPSDVVPIVGSAAPGADPARPALDRAARSADPAIPSADARDSTGDLRSPQAPPDGGMAVAALPTAQAATGPQADASAALVQALDSHAPADASSPAQAMRSPPASAVAVELAGVAEVAEVPPSAAPALPHADTPIQASAAVAEAPVAPVAPVAPEAWIPRAETTAGAPQPDQPEPTPVTAHVVLDADPTALPMAAAPAASEAPSDAETGLDDEAIAEPPAHETASTSTSACVPASAEPSVPPAAAPVALASPPAPTLDAPAASAAVVSREILGPAHAAIDAAAAARVAAPPVQTEPSPPVEPAPIVQVAERLAPTQPARAVEPARPQAVTPVTQREAEPQAVAMVRPGALAAPGAAPVSATPDESPASAGGASAHAAGPSAPSPLADIIRQARAAAPQDAPPIAPAPARPDTDRPAPRPAVRTEVLGAERPAPGALPSTRTRGTTLHPFPGPPRAASRPWRTPAMVSATLLLLAGAWWLHAHHRESPPIAVEPPPEVMRLPLAGPAAAGPQSPQAPRAAATVAILAGSAEPVARVLLTALAPLFSLPAVPAPDAHAAPPAPAAAPGSAPSPAHLALLAVRDALAAVGWLARTFPAPSAPTRATGSAPAHAQIPAAPADAPAMMDSHAARADRAQVVAAFLATLAQDPALRAELRVRAQAAITPLDPAADPERAYPYLGDGMTSPSAWLMLHDARDLP